MAWLDKLFSYSLNDFVLFSAETYQTLLEDYLLANSLLAFALIAVLVAGLYLAFRFRSSAPLFALSSLSWCLTAKGYYLDFYQEINPLARYLGYACLLQAGLTIWVYVYLYKFTFRTQTSFGPTILFALIYILFIRIGLGKMEGYAFGFNVIGLTPLSTVLLGTLISLWFSRPWILLLPGCVTLLFVECFTLKAMAFEFWWEPVIAFAALFIIRLTFLAIDDTKLHKD